MDKTLFDLIVKSQDKWRVESIRQKREYSLAKNRIEKQRVKDKKNYSNASSSSVS